MSTMNPTTLVCTELSQDSINSLRETTDSYIARTGHQFFRVDKASVRCVVCSKTLTAINSSQLETHTRTKAHQFLSQFDDSERADFTVETLKRYHQYLLKYECLQLYHRSSLQCTTCENVFFGVNTLTKIDKHMKETHNGNQKRKPLSTVDTNVTPSKRRSAAHGKEVYVQREIQRHNSEGDQILSPNQRDLLCICSQLFLPDDFSRYRETVQRHISSCAKHRKVVTGWSVCLFHSG